ncbi:hypothetical protein VKT23_019514 [Stygiomarasmius scandens]|uniref:Uncharacterized protein n=1 Tax=Marasmiellus scandens TaxID=2682957 RepID=A0ABR1IL86_9AGAR
MVRAYASGVVTVDEVLRHGLTAPDIPGGVAASARPLIQTQISFNLLTREGMATHTTNMTNMINAFEKYTIADWSNIHTDYVVGRMGVTEVIFFVVSHADPSSGDIHVAEEGRGAERLRVVFPELFPPNVRTWLKTRNSFLFGIVCGHKPISRGGYKYLAGLVET